MPSRKTATPPAAGTVIQDVNVSDVSNAANKHTRAAIEALAAAATANANAIAAIAKALEGAPAYGIYFSGMN